MKSTLTLTILLMAGLVEIFLTAGVSGQQLDLGPISRPALEQEAPEANEPASLNLEDDDLSFSGEPAEDAEAIQGKQGASTESETDTADEVTLKGEFAGTNWPRRTIQEIQIGLEQEARTPEDRSESLHTFGRTGELTTSVKPFAWAAPNIRYQPLYFEDVALERYGQTAPLHQQAIKSGMHFLKSFALLPHQMLYDHPHECDSPLGFCRPGTCVPRTVQRQYFGSVLAK